MSSPHMIRLGKDSQADSELARSSFKYRAKCEWNLLPLSIRQVEDIKIFKKEVKKWVAGNVPIS